MPPLVHVRVHGRQISVRTDVLKASQTGKLCSIAGSSAIFGGKVDLVAYPGKCGLAVREGGKAKMVTCAHIFFNPADQDEAGWCLASISTIIGWVSKWTQLTKSGTNYGDAASVMLYPDVHVESRRLLSEATPISGVADFASMAAGYFYVADNIRRPCVPLHYTTGHAYLGFANTVLDYAGFWRLQMQYPVQDGHSGSLIVVQQGGALYAAGILFGVTDDGYGLAYPAREMFARVNFSI